LHLPHSHHVHAEQLRPTVQLQQLQGSQGQPTRQPPTLAATAQHSQRPVLLPHLLHSRLQAQSQTSMRQQLQEQPQQQPHTNNKPIRAQVQGTAASTEAVHQLWLSQAQLQPAPMQPADALSALESRLGSTDPVPSHTDAAQAAASLHPPSVAMTAATVAAAQTAADQQPMMQQQMGSIYNSRNLVMQPPVLHLQATQAGTSAGDSAYRQPAAIPAQPSAAEGSALAAAVAAQQAAMEVSQMVASSLLPEAPAAAPEAAAHAAAAAQAPAAAPSLVVAQPVPAAAELRGMAPGPIMQQAMVLSGTAQMPPAEQQPPLTLGLAHPQPICTTQQQAAQLALSSAAQALAGHGMLGQLSSASLAAAGAATAAASLAVNIEAPNVPTANGLEAGAAGAHGQQWPAMQSAHGPSSAAGPAAPSALPAARPLVWPLSRQQSLQDPSEGQWAATLQPVQAVHIPGAPEPAYTLPGEHSGALPSVATVQQLPLLLPAQVQPPQQLQPLDALH
jgi:hypothetical protein